MKRKLNYSLGSNWRGININLTETDQFYKMRKSINDLTRIKTRFQKFLNLYKINKSK